MYLGAINPPYTVKKSSTSMVALTNWRSKMAITTMAKDRNHHMLRKVNQWVRHYPGSLSTPSQQAMESNTRDAYFWRR